MSTSKHEKSEGEDPLELEADNTEEGDVENGAGPNGEAVEGDVGRTNK
jgi:hypothetical protein